jgi:hypothetical protein
MKKLILLLSVISLTSCQDGWWKTQNAEVSPTTTTINGREVSIYVIDSCEYIGCIYSDHGDWATHKGNCKFCLERK